MKFTEKRSKILFAISLVMIFVVALLLRLHNVSAYLFYPDSYQSLLVANNINVYHSLVGTLGDGGMAYPQYLEWTRPLYPILIAIMSNFANSTTAAHIVAIGASLLSVMAAGLLGWVLTKRRLGVAVGMLVIGLSYGHTVWSGFVLTESLGVLVGLLFALWAVCTLNRIASPTVGWLCLGGLSYASLILVRYEYGLLGVAALAVLVIRSRQRLYDAMVLFAASLTTLAGVMLLLPVPLRLPKMQWAMLLAPMLVVALVSWLAITQQRLIGRYVSANATIVFWFTAVTIGIAATALPGARAFMLHDFVLCGLALIGLWHILHSRGNQLPLSIALLSIMLLVPPYVHINPDMERYYAHIIPWLLLLAVIGGVQVADRIKRIGGKTRGVWVGVIIVCLLGQSFVSYQGLHGKSDGIWFDKGYEQLSADRLGPYLRNNDLLITSMPDAYYYGTGQATESIYATTPYIDASIPDSQQLLIVNDMGMRHYFYDFYSLAATNLQSKNVGTYQLNVPFRYENKRVPEAVDVSLYRLSAKDLRTMIAISSK